MHEKEVHRKYIQEFQARTQIKAQANPQIAQVLQLSQALRDAYVSCEGDKSLYPIKRVQVLAQYASADDWEQKYNSTMLALQAEISRLKKELLLAKTDKAIYKGQLESNGIDPMI